MGDRYVQADENRKVPYIKYLRKLAYVTIFDSSVYKASVNLKEIRNIREENDDGYTVELDFKYAGEIKEKTFSIST